MSLQDPLSFRVVPQVHGAVRADPRIGADRSRDRAWGRNDNPLVAVEERVVVQSANFHPMLMALGFDALRPGLIHVGAISERRMSHLWERVFAGGTPARGCWLDLGRTRVVVGRRRRGSPSFGRWPLRQASPSPHST